MTNEELKIIAEDLPGSVGRKSDARSRLLCVQELLRYATDKHHGLTTAEICTILQYRAEDGKRPSEPTVLDDIHSIQENASMGMKVKSAKRGKNSGFRCTRSLLSATQIRMLQNIVRASKFVTAKQAQELNNDLGNILSFYEEDNITGSVYVDRRLRINEHDVLNASQKITEAIAKGKKIEFGYKYWTLANRTRVFRFNGTNVLCETPINLIYSFDNYYVETWVQVKSRNGEVTERAVTRRLDRMRDVAVSAQPADKNDEIDKLRDTVHERTQQTFDMRGGDVVELFLEVPWRKPNVIYNRFGRELRFENVVSDSRGRAERGYVRVRVQLSATFLRWIFGFQGDIKIVPPRGDMWNRAGSWAKLDTAGRSQAELRADYDKTMRMYREMLERVMGSIE